MLLVLACVSLFFLLPYGFLWGKKQQAQAANKSLQHPHSPTPPIYPPKLPWRRSQARTSRLSSNGLGSTSRLPPLTPGIPQQRRPPPQPTSFSLGEPPCWSASFRTPPASCVSFSPSALPPSPLTPRFAGEVALPGGKADEDDADDAATALREAKEEIGLDPALVTVVSSLEHFLSKHLLVVVPVVGILSDIHAFKPVLNVDEVDDIFDVPLEMFLKDERRRSEEREWMGQAFTLHHFDYEKDNKTYVIWGLTAGILIHAASVVYQRPPDFVERRVQFNLPKCSKEPSPMP